MSLHDISGERKAWLAENAVNDQHPFAPYQPSFIVPEYGSITAADNTTALYYKLYKPKDFKLGKNYPAVVYVYGGPHAQRVTNQWKGVDIAQLLAQSGYVVFQLDNRGSNYRGTAFEFPLYKKLGDVETSRSNCRR